MDELMELLRKNVQDFKKSHNGALPKTIYVSRGNFDLLKNAGKVVDGKVGVFGAPLPIEVDITLKKHEVRSK